MAKVLLIAYDNESRISYFPLGLAYIAGAIRNYYESSSKHGGGGGYVTVYNQDVYHYTEEHLTKFLDDNDFDVVGLSSCGGYFQYRKIKALTEAIAKSKNKHFVVIGGHLVSSEPEYFLRKFHCDAICIGEGEKTVVDLLDALESEKSLSEVKGIAFLKDDEFIQTERQALIENLDEINIPAYDLFPIDSYAHFPRANARATDRFMPILSGRGCIFTCNFCYRMDKGFRPRTAESILREITYLQKNYNITYIDFCDELLMSSSKRTTELCEAFIDSELKFRWSCNGRLNFAKRDILESMKKAGCVFINYGIESLDDTALRTMGKSLTVKQIIEGIENTLAAGISPGLNVIFGNIGENQNCLDKDVEFLLKYDDHAQLRTIRPVTPYPGSPLYDYAVQKGLIKDCEDFYENKHTNSDLLTVNFTDMTDDEFYAALHKANKILLDNYIENIKTKNTELLDNLYGKRDGSFRGFRHT